MKTLFTMLFTASLALGVSACGEAEEVLDCAQICNAYGNCMEELGATDDYDELQCIENCETKSDQSADFRAQADSCEMCLDQTDDTCLEDAFACATECTSVIIEVETSE